jgi:hypothetical protein
MIKKQGKIGIDKIIKNTLEHICLKLAFDLEIMNIENMTLTKIIHFYLV